MTIEFIRDQAFGTKDAFFIPKNKGECLVNEPFSNAECYCNAKIWKPYLYNVQIGKEIMIDVAYSFCGL